MTRIILVTLVVSSYGNRLSPESITRAYGVGVHNRTQGQFSFVRSSNRAVFNIEVRKTKTKAITMANHNKRKQHNEPMRTRSKYT